MAARSWNEEERNTLAAHIEEGYLQAERGELIDDETRRHEIQMLKGS